MDANGSGAAGSASEAIDRPSALLTDLYQLTMAQAYFDLGMHETAVFELFVRRLPRQRRFLVAAGLSRALQYLAGLRFTGAELDYLERAGLLRRAFLDRLATLRFTGSVHAMPEGSPFFADEPILRVTAPIIEAQLVESRLINILHFDSLIASKAARIVHVAAGRHLIDFGMRRAHGAEAALYAARAAYLAGFDATATVEAGRRFGIPLSGTMAHSFVQAGSSEGAALRDFVRVRGEPTTLLIDTYDTLRAAREVVAIARELRADGLEDRIRAVRLDSGDLDALSRGVRAILDEAGCRTIRIVASGGLDEGRVEQLVAADAPIDAFGVGTSLDVSADAPALDMAYKLQEYAGVARRKRSARKATWPGRKQVWRAHVEGERCVGDTIALESETITGIPMLREVMRDGRPVVGEDALRDQRSYCLREVGRLPAELLTLHGRAGYPVEISLGIRRLAAEVDARTA